MPLRCIPQIPAPTPTSAENTHPRTDQYQAIFIPQQVKSDCKAAAYGTASEEDKVSRRTGSGIRLESFLGLPQRTLEQWNPQLGGSAPPADLQWSRGSGRRCRADCRAECQPDSSHLRIWIFKGQEGRRLRAGDLVNDRDKQPQGRSVPLHHLPVNLVTNPKVSSGSMRIWSSPQSDGLRDDQVDQFGYRSAAVFRAEYWVRSGEK